MEKENNNLNHLGNTLCELRTAKGISLENLSVASNISKHDLNFYEKGVLRPEVGDIIALGKAMKIHPLDILSQSINRSKYFKAA